LGLRLFQQLFYPLCIAHEGGSVEVGPAHGVSCAVFNILASLLLEFYVARGGSEVCLSLNPPNTFCTQNGAVKETRLKLEFKQYEVYEEKI
jgi:hypothetical protein